MLSAAICEQGWYRPRLRVHSKGQSIHCHLAVSQAMSTGDHPLPSFEVP